MSAPPTRLSVPGSAAVGNVDVLLADAGAAAEAKGGEAAGYHRSQ
jgi:hypothetical protein